MNQVTTSLGIMYFLTKLVIADIALKMNKYFKFINFTEQNKKKFQEADLVYSSDNDCQKDST